MDNKKINIGLFIDTWFPMVDGVINVVDNYAKRLSKIANVTVFSPRVDKNYDISKFPYKIVLCKSSKFLNLDYRLPLPKLDRNFKKEIKNAKLDIIHIHSPFSIGKMAVNYGRKHKIPVIATFHSQFERDFYRATKSKFLTKILLNKIIKVFEKADICWAVNKNIASVFQKYGYKKEAKIVNNGTDLFPIKNIDESNKKINSMFKIKNDEKVLLFIGRLTILKNILFIVEALKLVKDQGYNFKMLFVGSGQDQKILTNFINELNLENEIKVCGRITDRNIICGLYARAYIFLFPSLYDASSLVQIEASSQKTPTIFLEGAVTAGTVTNNLDGFIVENNIKAFAEKIIELFNNQDYRNEIGEKAFKNLYKNWDDVINDAYKEYLNIIKERKT